MRHWVLHRGDNVVVLADLRVLGGAGCGARERRRHRGKFLDRRKELGVSGKRYYRMERLHVDDVSCELEQWHQLGLGEHCPWSRSELPRGWHALDPDHHHLVSRWCS